MTDRWNRQISLGDYVIWGSGGVSDGVTLHAGRVTKIDNKFVTAVSVNGRSSVIRRADKNIMVISGSQIPPDDRNAIDRNYNR